MKKAFMFSFVILAFSVAAHADQQCPNLAGQYKVTSEVQNGVSQPMSNPVTLTIEQTGCQDVKATTTTAPSDTTTEDLIVDGQSHALSNEGGVSLNQTSHFEGASLVTVLQMQGQNVGTMTISLSQDGKTLTYTMVAPENNGVVTAVRQ